VEDANNERISFYLDRARESGASALELGCGTGVIAVALALEAIVVLGLDPAEALIAQALRRRRALGLSPESCRFERGDLRSARLGRRFSFVYAPSDALLALPALADLEAVFATARAHLEGDGAFAFDLRQHPSPAPEERPSRSALNDRPDGRRRPHLVSRGEGARAGAVHRLSLLTPSPEQLEGALASSGFVSLERYGDFRGGGCEPTSERMVVVARPA
jgi:SAM-dependent methyltransferase